MIMTTSKPLEIKATNGTPAPQPLDALHILSGRGQPVLLVEDDSIDIMTVKRAFKELGIDNKLVIANNGSQAIAYLENRDEMPMLILLDLNMPNMNGVEFLRIFKKNPKFKNIPVVVLTTSKADQDVQNCAELDVSGYVVKPVEYKEFIGVVDVIYRYWKLNHLPL